MAVATISPTNSSTAALEFGAKTQSESMMMVKKLIAVAMSNITYLRAICPEAAYAEKTLDDMTVKILRDDNNYCPKSRYIVKWIRGSFDALDKKYLRQIIFGIYKDPDKADTLIESYKFDFVYYGDKASFGIARNNKPVNSISSVNLIKKSSVSLLRTLIVLLQNLDPLPDDCRITMKLLYYDDVTPPDYDPPGFRPTTMPSFDYENKVVSIRIGQVATSYHAIKLFAKVDARQLNNNDDSDEEVQEPKNQNNKKELRKKEEIVKDKPACSKNVPVPDKQGHNLSREANKLSLDSGNSVKGTPCPFTKMPRRFSTSSIQKPVQTESKWQGTPKKSKTPFTDIRMAAIRDQSYASQSQENNKESRDEGLGVKCFCGLNDDDGLMILCEKCNYWQHAICYKIRNDKEAPVAHICKTCAKEKSVDETKEKKAMDIKNKAISKRRLLDDSQMSDIDWETASIQSQEVPIKRCKASFINESQIF